MVAPWFSQEDGTLKVAYVKTVNKNGDVFHVNSGSTDVHRKASIAGDEGQEFLITPAAELWE